MRLAPALALVLALVEPGCHVTTRTEVTHARSRTTEPHRDAAVAQAPTIVLAAGELRFVEPLVCPSDELVVLEPELQIARGPNLATFVVGVIAVAGGAIAAISAAGGDSPGDNPLTYAGVAGIAAGLPFAIGPWLGNHVEAVPAPDRTERRPGPEVPCGSRAVTAAAAGLTIGDHRIHAAIGPDGALAVSPFTWIDAFDPTGGPAFSIRAELDTRSARTTVDKVIEAGALAPWRDAYLAAAHVDATVEPLRAVPHLTQGQIRLGQVRIGGQAMLHVILPLVNAGPGDAWQVRAVIASPSPELDGRIVYVGHIAPRTTTTGEQWIPLSPGTGELLRGATLDLGFRLIDAHQVLPATPLEFHGPVADDGSQ